MPKKILVTGADGFIGSHLTEALVRAGYDVRAFVLYNSFNSWGWLDRCGADMTRQVRGICGRHPRSSRSAHRAERLRGGAAFGGAHCHSLSPTTRPIPTSTPISKALSTSCRLPAIWASIEWCIPRPARYTGRRDSCPSPRSIRCKVSRRIRRPKSAPTRSRCRFTRLSATPVTIVRPFNTYGPRQSARAVIPTIITQIASGAAVKSNSVHCTRPATSATWRTRSRASWRLYVARRCRRSHQSRQQLRDFDRRYRPGDRARHGRRHRDPVRSAALAAGRERSGEALGRQLQST